MGWIAHRHTSKSKIGKKLQSRQSSLRESRCRLLSRIQKMFYIDEIFFCLRKKCCRDGPSLTGCQRSESGSLSKQASTSSSPSSLCPHHPHRNKIVIYTTRFKDPFALQMFLYPHIFSSRRKFFPCCFKIPGYFFFYILGFQDIFSFTFLGFFSFTFFGLQDTFFFYFF